MSAKKILVTGLAALVYISLIFSATAIALAQSGGAGTLDSPYTIASLPFSESVDTSSATVGPADPLPGCAGWDRTATRWYAFTPTADMKVKAAAGFSYYNNTTLTVFSVAGGALTEFACSTNPGDLVLTLTANQPYYFMLGGYSWSPWPYGPPVSMGSMSFSLLELFPPANDNFANAQVITGLPFSVSPDLSQATIEPFEPSPSCWGPSSGSVWYAFTPGTGASLSVTPNGPVAVYTGSSLAGLSEVACGAYYWNSFTFRPQAGTTYYFQVPGANWWGWVGFNLDRTPPPSTNVGYYPGDPSTYDPVNFYCDCADPGNVGFQSIQWKFGDGATAEGQSSSHTYASDGDYTVNLTAATLDGRTASASTMVPVRTHDVAIADFKVPAQVKAGQKHKFVVSLANNHYLETVKVELYKNTPAGLTLFAALVQDVPAGKTTLFNFDYLFSQKDAADGVNTFQAVATLIGFRDAQPGNNTLTLGAHPELKALRDWSIFSGQWTILNGQLTSTSNTPPYSYIWAGNPPLDTHGDLTASFTLKLTNTQDWWVGPHGGIMFFASVPTGEGDPRFSGYMIDWYGGWWTEGIRLRRWDNGQAVFLVRSGTANISNPPQQWQVKVEGEWIRFYGDGVLLFEVQDNTYRSGKFGFWAYSNGTAIALNNIQIGSKFSSLLAK